MNVINVHGGKKVKNM